MNSKNYFLLFVCVWGISCATGEKNADISDFDISSIEAVIGTQGELNEKEGVYKFSIRHDDLNVIAGGVKMNPKMGLTTSVAFNKPSGHAQVMGDIVLTEGQVNTVMSAALESSLDVTSLHNHFFDDNPKIMSMHISGTGVEKNLAQAVKNVFNAMEHSKNMTFPRVYVDPSKSTLDPKKLNAIFKKEGLYQEGVYKISFGRKTEIEKGDVGEAMGVSTGFSAAGSSKTAVANGSIVMLESELQPVLRILRKGGIQIVGIHHALLSENPKLVFLHYWGTGTSEDLAKAIQSALSAVSYGRK